MPCHVHVMCMALRGGYAYCEDYLHTDMEELVYGLIPVGEEGLEERDERASGCGDGTPPRLDEQGSDVPLDELDVSSSTVL